MKKVFSFSLLIAAFAVIGFTSCKPHTPPPPPDPTATETDFLQLGYIGDAGGGAGYYFYVLQLTDKGMVSNGEIVKAGNIYRFVLIRDANEPVNGKFNITAGTYNGTAAGSYEVNTFELGENSTVTPVDASGKDAGTATSFTSGTLTFEANKITFKGKTADKDYEIVYNGTYEGVDARPNPWLGEPETATTINETFVAAVALTNYGDFYQNGTTNFWAVISDNANQQQITKYAALDILDAAGRTALADGVYNISDTKAAGTVIKSSGLKGQKFTPSYYINRQVGVYYLVSGTVTVSGGNTITVNATSHFGSTINLTYSQTDAFVWGNPPSNAPAKIARF